MTIPSIINHIFPQLILIFLLLKIGIALCRYFYNNKQRLSVMVIFLLLAGGWITTSHTSAADAAELSGYGKARQEILILNSYHPGYAWSDGEQAGIIDVFRAKDENWLPIIEYLDFKRLPDGRHLAELKQFFRLKYQNKKFSVVIAMDNPALEFAVDNQAGLFGNAPIVFCGINNYTPSQLKGRSEVTGIVEAIDIAGTIEVMLRLHPAAQEIFSPQDYTTTGLAIRKELEALVPRFGAKVRFRFTDPMTMKELLGEMERLPKNSLVLAVGFITDKSGRAFDTSETTKLFYEHSPVPIYSTFEQQLGFGIVGGKLLNARVHGTNTARIALRVLAGEKASAIPVVFESDSQFMFDYKVMSRFGIPLSALPAGSTVINKPVSFYAAHRIVIQTASSVVFFLIIIIILLAINIAQRKRSVEVIRRSEELLKVITSGNPDHILVQDSKLRFLFVLNPALGLTVQDMIGKTDHDLLSKEDAEKLTIIKKQVLETGNPVHVEIPLISRNGEQQFFGGSYIPKYDAKGKVNGLVGYFRNITERKRIEEALRESVEKYRSLSATVDSMYLVDRNGKYLFMNDRHAERFGLHWKDVVGKSYSEFHSEESTREFIQKVEEVFHTGEPVQHEHYSKKDGRCFLRTFSPVKDSKRSIISVTVVSKDITDRKKAEEMLRESEEQYRFLFENMMNGFAYCKMLFDDHGRPVDFVFLAVNKAFEKLTGLKNVLQKKFTELIPDIREATPEVLEIYSRVTLTGIPERFEVYSETFGGWLYICAYSAGKGCFAAIFDNITDRKQVEETLRESEERFRVAQEVSPDGFTILRPVRDAQGRVVDFTWVYENTTIARLNGTDPKAVVGQRLLELFPSHAGSQFLKAYQQVAETGEHCIFEAEYSGETLTTPTSFRIVVVPISTDIAILAQDITERKRAEEKILTSLREREILLREMHHRVKNNMQVISSLLDLQARASGNPDVIQMSRESQKRIRSMALIHERFYHSEDFAKINLGDYVKALSRELSQSYSVHSGAIALDIQIESNVFLDIQKAIPCGLILSELISNALKHAFTGDGKGKITVIINESATKEIEIILRDNGLGLTGDVDIHQTKSVGLHLVSGLVKNQLGGQMEVRRDNGTEFRIKFFS